MQEVTLWLHISTEHFVKVQIGITQWDSISFTGEYKITYKEISIYN